MHVSVSVCSFYKSLGPVQLNKLRRFGSVLDAQYWACLAAGHTRDGISCSSHCPAFGGCSLRVLAEPSTAQHFN